MLSRLRAIASLAVIVGLIAWGANVGITRIAERWVQQDARQRGALAVSSAAASLAQHWRASDVGALRNVLLDIAADDQVLATAACTSNDRMLVRTERFPATLTCARARALTDSAAAAIPMVDGAPISAVPLRRDGTVIGLVLVLHDARQARLRELQIKSLAFAVFAIFGVAAIVFALLNQRFLRRSWTSEIRAVLGGFSSATEFRTLLDDVRTLAARATSETDARDEERAWTEARVHTLVQDTLGGARVIVLANREPLIHQRNGSEIIHMRPASGLVTALEPVIRATAGTWVAHGSGSADRDVVDVHDRVTIGPDGHAYTLRRVWLSDEEEAGYYYGFANEGLWPLCHLAHRRPTFSAPDYESYRAVNERFVDAVCDEVTTPDPVILVQDYHFALAPRLLRQRLPAATVVAFWHIPWPNGERFSICPWRAELLDGMLGATIVGFHTQQHCNNFIDAVDATLEARIDRERNAVVRNGGETLVRPYPISVEWPYSWGVNAPAQAECRARLTQMHGLPANAAIVVGVDRMDYTKGLEERLRTVERLLELNPSLVGRLVLLQICAPSRSRIPLYQTLAESVAAQARRINARFATAAWSPIVLIPEHRDHDVITMYYRGADACYVSSLHDGMNLVAKEFIASRDDESGVLMLSHFTGASRELTEALVVNPYDIDASARAMDRALHMPLEEQRERMRALRAQVRESNVFRWAGRLLNDAARSRRKAQLAERLARVPLDGQG